MNIHIRTNLSSLIAQKQLRAAVKDLTRSQSHLGSGDRIWSAAEAPTDLAVSEHYSLGKRTTAQNIRNAYDSIGYLQVTDGALGHMTQSLIRLRELSMQAANGVTGDRERRLIGEEFREVKEEIERIAQTTRLGFRWLLNGKGGDVEAQVGPGSGTINHFAVTTSHEVTLDRLGLTNVDVSSLDAARRSLASIDAAMSHVVSVRGAIGASESRLNSTIANLEEFKSNVSAAYGRIRDTEYSSEATEAAKANILTQSSSAVLAQANNVPQLALQLLG